MLIKKNATMIGEFTDRGPKLFTEKSAGNVCGCIGFAQDKNTKLNVPNTLLKKDFRIDKSLDLKERYFSETIENMIDRDIL